MVYPIYEANIDRLRKKVERIRKKAEKAKEARSDETSRFVGTEGERITVVGGTVDVVTSWETQYGTTIRYKIRDAAGNVLMWDSSTGIYTNRPVLSIKGTVKKHDIYNGVRQTWLTRCRVEYAKAEER